MQLTCLQQMPIAEAARLLKIKYSTAKLIVKRYKDDGTFFESRQLKRKRLEKEDHCDHPASDQSSEDS